MLSGGTAPPPEKRIRVGFDLTGVYALDLPIDASNRHRRHGFSFSLIFCFLAVVLCFDREHVSMGTIESVQAAVAESQEEARTAAPLSGGTSLPCAARTRSDDWGVARLLSKHGVSTSSYGREGCLTVRDLAREVAQGFCKLEPDESGRLLRSLTLVEITLVVRITGGRLALIEEEQILDDGRKRRFPHRKLHGKLMKREDNRLRVERDELQHAQQEKERQKVERKEAFDSKLRKLRRNAAGEPAIEEDRSLSWQTHSEPPLSVATSAPSEPSAPPRVRERKDEGDAYGKYGVTKSGLKQAEQDLDKSLRGKGPMQGRSYWGKEGLGSGPHINLFEEAELAVKQQETAHSKLLRYQETNNNLADTWPKSQSFKTLQLTDPYRQKHDQLILKVVKRKKEASTALALGCELLARFRVPGPKDLPFYRVR
eukprot:s4129_g4.t1